MLVKACQTPFHPELCPPDNVMNLVNGAPDTLLRASPSSYSLKDDNDSDAISRDYMITESVMNLSALPVLERS